MMLLISPFDNRRPIPLFVQHSVKLSFKPGHKKTCIWGFRPGLTQNRLYSHRRLSICQSLEILDLEIEWLYQLCSKNKGT